MKTLPLKTLKLFTVGFIATESLLLAYFMRPIQDDYFNLESVQQMGVFSYLRDVWNNHGGNMVQFFIHCIMILPTTNSFVFWNFGLFFLLTEVLFFFTIRDLLGWLLLSKKENYLFWIPLLAVAGFEGLFVPGFLGAYGFSLATLAHLWPVMAIVTGLISLRNFRGSWVIALLLGLVAGNSNLGESVFACTLWVSVFTLGRISPHITSKLDFSSGKNFYILGIGTLIGTIGIAVAPGFWTRASDQVGLPSSLPNFLWRFVKSTAIFTADGLTHPMVWVIFLIGAMLARRYQTANIDLFELRIRVLFSATLLIWVWLILGSTFAYPAWHQSMGMYVLLFPAAFGGGLRYGMKFDMKFLRILLVTSSLTMSLCFARVGVLGISRSLSWDRNLTTNFCLLKHNPEAKLFGAEIRYPPFNLGVEDVNTWEWMRYRYAGWVLGVSNRTECQ